MSEHETFHFHSLDELRKRISELGLSMEAVEDTKALFEPIQIGAFRLPNRVVILPMEGADGKLDGSPDELTVRRYRRFAAGGAGLLWLEATAVIEAGRANPRQIWLHPGTVDAFARMVDDIHAVARESVGPHHRPMLIVQLTHSGRYSRPGVKPHPIIAHHSPLLDPTHQLPPDYPLITDDELEQLEDVYVEAARLAKQAGFDGVDIKACHRYLVSELHASFMRDNSRYGGSFSNRTRFIRNVVGKIRAAVPGLLVTSRMNAYDAMAYPYGFGVSEEDASKPDLTEPLELIRFLKENGAPLVNITIGNPYFNPHVNRPFDLPTATAPIPSEHPLVGVDRFFDVVRQIQARAPDVAVVGGGYSWLRQYFPYFAAANIKKGHMALAGIGRMAIAYPDCLVDLQREGKLNPRKVCVACSACTQIMRDGGKAGCVPRDSGVYQPIYKAGRLEALDTILKMAKTCRQCNDPSCVTGCPARVDIPKFVNCIVEGRFQDAYETLRESNILAATCGYICPSETQCEATCLNRNYSQTVPIRHLQRWVGRKAVQEGWTAVARPGVPRTGKRVAVVGAGPAGISAATALAALGHHVTLLDQQEAVGGVARATIPAERLPDAIITREIRDVIASYGDRIVRQQVTLGLDYDLDTLMSEGYDAVLLAMGLTESVLLGGAQRPKTGVMSALEILSRVKKGERFSGAVLVLGGGNTAMDAAISAKHAGADEVGVVYRRSFAEMPAWPEEREHAIHEGVHFLTLTAPLDYAMDLHGQLMGLKVTRTQLGPPDAKGRRAPVIIPNTEHFLPANLVVEAIGQRVSDEVKSALKGIRLTDEGLVWVQEGRLETSRPRVYAAGDLVNGGATVVQAVAEGARAAREIDKALAVC